MDRTIQFKCNECQTGFERGADEPVFKYFNGYGMVAMIKCPDCTSLVQTNVDGPWDEQ